MCVSNNECVVRNHLLLSPTSVMLTALAKVKAGNTFTLTSECKSYPQAVVLVVQLSNTIIGRLGGWYIKNKYDRTLQSHPPKPQQRTPIITAWNAKGKQRCQIIFNNTSMKSSCERMECQKTTGQRILCTSNTNTERTSNQYGVLTSRTVQSSVLFWLRS